MEQRMVLIENMMDARVGVADSTTGLKRRWLRRGQVLPIPFDAVQQLIWQDGFRRMLDQGILYIKSMKDKQDLGLEPIGAKEPENIKVLTVPQMESLLKEKPLSVFKRELTELPDVQIDNLIDYAITNKIVDSQKCDVLKQITGRDILKAISRAEDIAAEERAEKMRQSEGRRI